jgi:2-methylcitrate dehydratase PrpD
MPVASLSESLASWAAGLRAGPDDVAFAERSLRDTLAVAAAARGHLSAPLARELGEAGRLAMLAHLIDYDDLHIPSTTHISAVCVPAALMTGGNDRAYLAGAGVMARLGVMLGWPHYDSGWHATCTAGAPAAAVAAGVALGLDAEQLGVAIALAVPGAGGVNAAFGTDGKSLQVGFAVDAGVRAARLAAAGATADRAALAQWLRLVGGTAAAVELAPVVPGGVAVKPYPCCYALQRVIAAVDEALDGRSVPAGEVERVTVSLARDVLRPLVHQRPRTGLEGKFSLPYAVAAAVLDERPGLWSFTDRAVRRPEARALMERVEVVTTPGGGGLLAGTVEVEIALLRGGALNASVAIPPGAPERGLSYEQLSAKVLDCAGAETGRSILDVSWNSARQLAAEIVEMAVPR